MTETTRNKWLVQHGKEKHYFHDSHAEAVAYIRRNAAPKDLNMWYIKCGEEWFFFVNAEPDFRKTGSTAGTWLPREAMEQYKRMRDTLLGCPDCGAYPLEYVEEEGIERCSDRMECGYGWFDREGSE